MQSKISFFSGAIYRKNLARCAPVWIAYLGLWVIIMPLAILSKSNTSHFDLPQLQSMVLRFGLVGGNIINFFYAILIAMSLFSWQYQTRSVNTIAALPIRREAHFLTNLLSALTFSIVPNLLIALMSWGASAAIGFPSAVLMLQWFGIVTLEFLFCFGLASLCAVVVGQILSLPILYALVNFAAVVLNVVTVSVLSTFVYGMQDNGYTYLGKFSPVFYIATHLRAAGKMATGADGLEFISAYEFHDWTYLLVLAAAGAVLWILAFLLFRRRRMEAAGGVIAVRPLRPVFKYCFTVGCSLVLGVLAATVFFSGANNPSLIVMTLCLLLGGFVGYFTSEILLQKTFHVFRREWIGYGVFALCLATAIGLMECDVFGFERRVPEASDVESITLDIPYYRTPVIVSDSAYISDLITLHQSIIQNKDQQEALENRYYDEVQHTMDQCTLTLVYQLKNGKTLSREYTVYSDEAMWRDPASLPRQFSDLCNDPALLTLCYTIPFDVTPATVSYSYLSYYDPESDSWENIDFTNEQALELYNDYIMPDLRDGLLGQCPLYYFSDHDDTTYMAGIFIEFVHHVEAPTTQNGSDVRVTLGYEYIDIDAMAGSRTASYLEALGLDLMLRSDYERLHNQEQKLMDSAAMDAPLS